MEENVDAGLLLIAVANYVEAAQVMRAGPGIADGLDRLAARSYDDGTDRCAAAGLREQAERVRADVLAYHYGLPRHPKDWPLSRESWRPGTTVGECLVRVRELLAEVESTLGLVSVPLTR